ncbi:MAG TPA: NUDIX domain-containing protein [Candidatus Thermoplasmatota archaeon]|nr:NUDIX domain-containing protein [Candidatus Thermoplasmatota archaeon]
MTHVRLVCITMVGNEYALWERDGLSFPHGDVGDGESPADAARRVVEEWTGTKAPKLELADLLAEPGSLTLVFRAMLTEEPKGSPRRAKRMELPEKVGLLSGKYVEDALKTSLNYKLTRG